MERIELGKRKELMVDDFLFEKLDGAAFALHQPVAREIAIYYDAPWEGSNDGFQNIVKMDDGTYRMYYVALNVFDEEGNTVHDTHPVYYCMMESEDGLHWTRPNLGLYEYNGSYENNIVLYREHLDNLSVFIDENPACLPEEKFKGFAYNRIDQAGVLERMVSPDGIHWKSAGVVLKREGFDSLNLGFWDKTRKQYFLYSRGFHTRPHEGIGESGEEGKLDPLGQVVRDVRVCTSKDFVNWSEEVFLDFMGAPDYQLYTNMVMPCPGAEHLLIGFPTRYYERPWLPVHEQLPDPRHRAARRKISERYATAATDGLFMSSRDGFRWKRWDDTAFIPNGVEHLHNWTYGDAYQAWGLIQTPSEIDGAPNELTMYATEKCFKQPDCLRRYTLRKDGFVSLHAQTAGATLLTKPLAFTGSRLTLNYSTTVAGHVFVEVQDESGAPVPGFALSDCDELYGDTVFRTVTWRGGESDVSALAGKTVRLRIRLKEADLYALRFGD